MLPLALIVILTAFSAPEIIVDEGGFVTVVESPEKQATEQRNMDMLDEAARAYRNYRNTGEGDLDELISLHERILASDMELVPKARQMIGNQLADLHREHAIGILTMSPERYLEIKGHPVLSSIVKDKEEEQEYLKYKEIELYYQEQIIEQLPEENLYYAAQQFYTLALAAANTLDAHSRQQCARYMGRSRLKALEAAQKAEVGQREHREALDLAESAGNFLLSELKNLKNAAFCREFIAAYPDDKELVEKIEKLLGELESN
ncbi:MAG: hypothetical protein GX130_13040 [Candidatus Hydrogenedens sp.]|jgi:hypothetical protein|nr:hypothetical protein [Candidatus Hydrogenedens sp.]